MRPIQVLRLRSPAIAGSGFLDQLATTPRCALSLTKVISTATVAIRVRRSSDNAEQDVGFTGTALDTASLAAFVGANSAFVVTFYDQTGNGFHATQATAANQARIVNAGVYDGKLVFDGTNDSYRITALTQGAAQVGVYGKFRLPNNTTLAIIAEQSTNYNSNAQSFVIYRDSTTSGELNVASRNTTGGSDFRLHTYGVTTGLIKQVTTLLDRSIVGTGENAVWETGVSKTATVVGTPAEQTGVFSTYDIYIGARAGTSLFGNLELVSLVFYNANTAPIRTSIEAVVA